MTYSVQQRSRGVLTDGSSSAGYTNRDGLLEINSIQGLYDYALRAGRVFVAGPDAVGILATLEANAAFDLTEPFFRATVPAATVMIPIMVQVTYDTAPAALDAIKIGWGEGSTYNTGGDVCRVLPMGHLVAAAPVASTLTNVRDGDAVLTEDTLVNPRIFFDKMITATGSDANIEYNALKGDPYVVIPGPASFLVWGKAAGAEEVYYNVVWIELDKSSVVNS